MSSSPKNFWLIIIQEKELIVSLVSHSDDKIQIQGIGEKQTWSGSDEKELISAVDISLTTCSESCHLTEDREPDDVALILSPFWVDEKGEIISPKASLLEKLCTKFDLNPLGFMVDDEAIADARDQKGSLSNSFILIHLSHSEFRLSLVHLGKIKARAKYSYDQNLSPKELETAIQSLKTNTTLPPQIIFWGKTDPTLEEQMLNYPWMGKQKGLGFLHFPEFKILDDQELLSIFSQIIAQEMIQALPSPKKTETSPETKLKPELESEPETPPAPEEQNFGFVSDDIAKKVQTDFQTSLPPTPSSFEETATPQPQPEPLKKKFSLPKLPGLKLPSFTIPSLFKKKPAFLFILLVFLSLSVFLWYYFPKADVVLYVKPEPIEFTNSATFDPTIDQLDPDQMLIPVKELTFSISKNKEGNTTGQITVGEKSKGEVKIQNRTDERFDLPKGTVIISDTELSFYLTSEISIASKTPDFESGLDHWGETKAMLEATQIGPEYNLSESTRFTAKDYNESNFVITGTESFTGGYSETVRAVSREDHQNLEDSLLSEIEEELPKTILEETSSEDLLLKNSTQTEIENIEYSREIGEKAESLSATATVNITVQLLEGSTQAQIIEAFLNPNLSSDLTLNPESINVSISEDQELLITATTIPIIDTEKLIQDLLGLKEDKAFDLLQSVPRVYRYTLTYRPELPGFLKALPRRSQNIKIDVKH